MLKFPLAAAALSVGWIASTALAAPPAIEPVDVIIQNGSRSPVPVQIQPEPPGATAVCSFTFGAGGGLGPTFTQVFTVTSGLTANCPDRIAGLEVERISFSPELDGPGADDVAYYRVTVGVDDDPSSGDSNPASGILAVLTNGAPTSDVLQPFFLDPNDLTQVIYVARTFGAPFQTLSTSMRGALVFIGTPVF